MKIEEIKNKVSDQQFFAFVGELSKTRSFYLKKVERQLMDDEIHMRTRITNVLETQEFHFLHPQSSMLQFQVNDDTQEGSEGSMDVQEAMMRMQNEEGLPAALYEVLLPFVNHIGGFKQHWVNAKVPAMLMHCWENDLEIPRNNHEARQLGFNGVFM